MANSTQPMRDKICLVTGATLGIGQVTARALAEQDALPHRRTIGSHTW